MSARMSLYGRPKGECRSAQREGAPVGFWRGLVAGLALAVAQALLAGSACAHKPSDSYLTLDVADGAVSGRWDIALRDLDHALGLDADGDGLITWGELRSRHGEIAAYATARLAVTADGAPCTIEVGTQQVDTHTDGAYTVLPLRVACPRQPSSLGLAYTLFADLDPQHRGLLQLTAQGSTRAAILGPQAPQQRFELGQGGGWAQFMAYLHDGVWHIWIGFDHILFLLALLLPAVGVWAAHRWQPVDGLRAGVLGRAAHRHQLHRGALDHALAGHAGLRVAAIAPGGVGDRRLGRAGGAEQRVAAVPGPALAGGLRVRARARFRFCQRAGRPGASAGHAGAGAGGLQRRRRSWGSWSSCWFSCRWPMRCGTAGSTGAA